MRIAAVVIGFSACFSACASRSAEGDVASSTSSGTIAVALVGEGVNQQEASSATAVALSDDRLTDLLAANSYEVESVLLGESSRGLVVSVRFDTPLNGAVYPLDACAIDTYGSPITGVRWLVQGDKIAAVSPIWGEETSCGY